MSPRFFILIATLGVFTALPARALVIKNFSDATDSRFTSNTSYSSWIDTAPLNPSFDDGAYDFGGVAWRYNASDATASRQGIPLVSSLYAITAWHVVPGLTESVRFRNSLGSVITVGIQSTTRIGTTDLVLVRLASAATNVTFLPVLDLGDDANWLGANLTLHGRGSPGDHTSPRTGDGSVNALGEQTVSGSTGMTISSRYVTATTATGEAYFQTGDSGSPMLSARGGALTLAGINWAVGTGTGFYDSVATRIIDYKDAINAVMAADGQSLSIIPEPSTVLLLFAAVGILGLSRRLAGPR